MQLAVIDHNVYISTRKLKEPEAIRNKNTANHLQMECDPSKREKRIRSLMFLIQ